MNNKLLGKLSALPADAILGEERFSEILAPSVTAFDRLVSIETLRGVIDAAKTRYTDDETGLARPSESDQFLAVRLHAALRLTKREAASQDVWNFLAAYAFPDYVCWRWGKERQSALSITTSVKKHPFKRLWWGAEMFRNGPSYDSVAAAFARTDVANTLLATRVMNNRAVALAVLEFLQRHELGSRQVNPVSTQLNTAAVTVALDFACPNYSDSLELDAEWLREEPDLNEVLMHPEGPQHGFASLEEIENASKMLDRVIDLGLVRKYRRSAA